MDYYKVIFFHALFVLYFVLYSINKKRNPTGLILIGVYVFSSFMAVLHYRAEFSSFKHISLLAYIVLFVILVVCFHPILYSQYNTKSRLIGIHEGASNVLYWFLIILFLPGVFQAIHTAVSNFSGIMADMSLVSEIYGDVAEMQREMTGSSLKNLPIVFRNIFSEVVVFVFFYYLTKNNKKKIVVILLALSLLYPFISSFNIASRTSMTYWVFEMVIAAFLFWRFFTYTTKKVVKTTMISGISLVVFIFGALTIGRFAYMDAGEDYTQSSLIAYSGKSTMNFANDVFENDTYQWGDGTAPLFRRMIGLDSSDNLYKRQEKWSGKMKIKQGTFYTFVGDLSFDYTIVGAFLLLSLSSLYITKRTNKSSTFISVDKLFLLYFWCNLCLCGLFYLSYKTIGGNLKLIVNVLFYIGLRSCLQYNNNKIKTIK